MKSRLALSAASVAGAVMLGRIVRGRRRYSLRGKNVLITGGSRGLGLEMARVLVDKGAHVAVVARDEAEISRALEDLRSRAPAGVNLVGRACDIESGESIDAMLKEIHTQLGPVDVLINNAGTIQIGPLEAMGLDDFEHAVRMHLFGPLRLMLALREPMRSRGGGRVANISSIGGVVSVPHLLPYSASKFALTGLSLGMRAELAKDGIVVTTVAPGLMRTGSPRKATVKGSHEKEYAWFAISDALPLLSVSSTRAARRIVQGIERGEAHVIIGAAAKLAALAQGLAPGWVANMLALANRVLPKGSDAEGRVGAESESAWVPSPLTRLNTRAEAANNQT